MKLLSRERPPEFLSDILLNLDFTPVPERAPELMLEWREESLWLLDGRTRQLPVRVDFLEDYARLRIGKDDLLAKAVGVRRGLRRVVDLTAGWGQDSLRLLKLGCEVIAVERSPVLHALLRDGLRRAAQDTRWRDEILPRFELRLGEARDLLPGIPAERREVLFMDPMFPERRKGALAKGEMQLLQALLGPDSDIAGLRETAWHYTGRRLVYKSPRLTPAADPKPDLEFEGRSVRYDVWLKSI